MRIKIYNVLSFYFIKSFLDDKNDDIQIVFLTLFSGAFCSVLVKETDFYFRNTAQFRINVDGCFFLDKWIK